MQAESKLTSKDFLLEQNTEGGVQLGQFVDILKRRALLVLGITALTVVAIAAKSVMEKPTYEASFELLTPPVTLETEIISAIDPEALSSRSETVGVGVLDETKLNILTSPRVMNPIVEELQKTYPNISYEEVRNGLKFTPNDQGKTLGVKYKSGSSGKVVDVLDTVSKAYLRYSLEDRQSDIIRGVDFVNEQLPAVRERVTELESELESLRRDANLIDPILQGEQLSAQLTSFTSDQLELGMLIEQAVRLYEDLGQELARGELASASALTENPRYQSLLDQLLEVDSQLANDLAMYQKDTPMIAATLERRENIRPLLEMEGLRVKEQVRSTIRELNTRNLALTRSIETLNQQIKELSSVTREYNTIQRELDIAATKLNEFLTKREALRIDAAQRQTPWELLIPPNAPETSQTHIGRNLLLGGILGLFLGSTIAITVDKLSNKIYSVKELKQAVPIPVLGIIPRSQLLAKGRLTLLTIQAANGQGVSPYNLAQNRQYSPLLEAFQRLATNIKLNDLDTYISSIAVSSALPNEGKSTVSLYLARASASMGRRTLLIDTDLRHPTLHKLCNVSNEKGLSNYLTGEVSLGNSLINLAVDENLFFMPSGPILSDPARVLSSRTMETFYKQVYRTFDLVIFDTPPLSGFADAFMIAKKTQGLLLAARLGQVKFSQLETVLDELYVSKIPTIGIVANDSTDDSRDYQNYYADVAEPGPILSTSAKENANTAVDSNGAMADSVTSNGASRDGTAAWKRTLHNIWGK